MGGPVSGNFDEAQKGIIIVCELPEGFL